MGVDSELHGISEFMASDWHSTPRKDSWQLGGPRWNIKPEVSGSNLGIIYTHK